MNNQPIDLRPTVRQASEILHNTPSSPPPVKPNKQGSFDEKCAWMRAKQAAKEAAAILKAERP